MMNNEKIDLLEKFMIYVISETDKSYSTISPCIGLYDKPNDKIKLLEWIQNNPIISLLKTYSLYEISNMFLKKITLNNNYYSYESYIKLISIIKVDYPILFKLFDKLQQNKDFYDFFNSHLENYFKDNSENYLKNISIYKLQLFLYAIDEVNYSLKSKLPFLQSNKTKDYLFDIKRLKKNAKELQSYSAQQIEIRLPKMPNDIISDLLFQLSELGESENNIKEFYFEYFKNFIQISNKSKNKRLPQNYNDFNDWIKKRYKLLDKDKPLKIYPNIYKPPKN